MLHKYATVFFVLFLSTLLNVVLRYGDFGSYRRSSEIILQYALVGLMSAISESERKCNVKQRAWNVLEFLSSIQFHKKDVYLLIDDREHRDFSWI